MTTTTDTDTATEDRIAALEKRLTQVEYRRPPTAPTADLAFKRTAMADIWVAAGPDGRAHLFLSYFEERAVGNGKAIPSVLVSGEVNGMTFTPFDERFPPVSHPDYVDAEKIAIG